MSLTRTAIEKSRVTFVVLAVLLFAGVRSYTGMPRAQDPGFVIRTALVITRFPGASPARVEQLVTDKLEKAIQEMPELDSLVSQSKPGVSIITVNVLDRYADMRPIWDKLRRKVERVAPDLPAGVQSPSVDDEFSDVFGTLVTLTGDGYSMAELETVAKEIRDELLLIDDVAKVDIYGIQDERIFVEYTNARLAELGLSPAQLRGILSARNIIDSGGQVRTPYEAIVLEPSGDFASVDELRHALIPLPSGDLLPLADIARVTRDYVDPPASKVHASGQPGLLLAVAMREDGNVVDLGVAIRATVERLGSAYPYGVDLAIVQDEGKIVDAKVQSFVSNLVQAVAIVLLVMLISLGPRTGLVVATLIPTAIITAFIFMPLWGVGIDQMSLAALIIALGLLVDNAIVMSESILVQMAEGQPPIEAAVSSASELALPLLISSLTTAAAFLPIYLAESAVGEYTGSLFKVVTITLLSSWVLALTVIPLLCFLFLRVPKKAEGHGFDSPFYRRYRRLLRRMLARPAITLVGVALVFVGSLQLFRFVPVIFFPDNDRPTLTAKLELPFGTPLATTEDVVGRFERFIADELVVGKADPLPPAGGLTAMIGRLLGHREPANGVLDYTTFVGNGGPRFYLSHSPEQASPAYALMLINTTTRRATDWTARRLQRFGASIPGLETTVDPLASGPPGGKPIEVRISGRDDRQVFDLVDGLKTYLHTIAGPVNVTDNWGARSKKLVVDIDDDRAQRAGVTHEDVALSLKAMLSGTDITTYREGDKIIPVLLRSNQAGGVALERFGSVNVFSQATGASVPIEQVAHAEVQWQPANIRRRNRLQSVAVQAELLPGFSVARVIPQIESWLQEESARWPLGYDWEIGGEDEASREANESIMVKLPIAGLLIVLLLVAQFNSLRRPAIILLTIPLGLIGAIIGLLVLRATFGFMTLLGIISLAGIVINNAIVLIDRIRVEIENHGHSAEQAVIESAQRRLRPILLTTFTTLGGMIPLYLGGGPLFESMAAAIMVGLVFATLLTLGVVPVLYAVFFRLSFRDPHHPEAS